MSNHLQEEASLYLKQHANNPVDWYPWGEEALQKAKKENKLLIISIGYSACHWCHVMERESFENEAVAQTMNKFFVSIKVDREERPDIDQIYMIAIQLMNSTGGWPLNCICLPDGRPVYGGTYFKPSDWQNLLLQIAQMWEKSPSKMLEYAEKLTSGIRKAEQMPIQTEVKTYTVPDLQPIITPWIESFDKVNGGYNRSPKFPLPNNWTCLLRYGHLNEDSIILDQVHLTLHEMAHGGIYDQVGGGFARYSVDERWHVPHFEKMLYDNGQLLSLYSEAYQHRPHEVYKRIVSETIDWLKREMLSPEGVFYSSLDADSESVEGKYYTFDYKEFDILGTDAPLFQKYFNLTEPGNWKDENTNVLFVDSDDKQLITETGFSDQEWSNYLADIKSKLQEYRSTRTRPLTDTKIIVSWNALTITGLIDAYRTFGVDEYLGLAINALEHILESCYLKDQKTLLHQPQTIQKKTVGFLDDYAFTIQALIALYEATFEEKWLHTARELMEVVLHLFYDNEAKCFYYTSIDGEQLIARKSEVMDNVIPSSSSTIVQQLYTLGLLLDIPFWTSFADEMVAQVFPHTSTYPSAYSNWIMILLDKIFGIKQIGLSGTKAPSWRQELDKTYLPNKILFGGTSSSLPVLQGKPLDQSKAYYCQERTCSLPQDSIEELLVLINNNK